MMTRNPAAETNATSVAADQLRYQVERIERLHLDKKAIEDDLKEIYGEVKSAGFDGAIVRKIIKERAKGTEERAEEIAIFDLYWQAIHGSGETGTPRATQARDAREAPKAAKPPVSAELVETVAAGMQTEIGRKALVTALDIMIEREEAVDQETGELVDLSAPSPAPAFSSITIPADQLVSVRYPDGVRKVPYAEFQRGVEEALRSRSA